MINNDSTAPAKTEAQTTMEEARPESLIDKHSSFDGLYRSTHNLRIQGVVDGEIDCQSTLTIDSEARVRAKVVAQNVTVGGSLEGEVNCPGRFEILPTGRVVGKVVAGMLQIHAGAFYQGDLSMQNSSDSSTKGNGVSGARIATATPIIRPLPSLTSISASDLTSSASPKSEVSAT
jgi:cytoskeletal protein CcmA (bactofilin family)